MTSTIEKQDCPTTDDLETKTKELSELIKKIRSESNLLPIFCSKRKLSESTIEQESNVVKESRLDKDIVDHINDYKKLMKRLSTFSFLFQHKPRFLSVLQCAEHGWRETYEALEKDSSTCVLVCDDCKKKFFVIEKTECSNQELIEQVQKKYENGLYDSHSDDCHWRQSRCEDKLYCFPQMTISEGLEKLKSVAKEILTTAQANNNIPLPALKHSLESKQLAHVKYYINHIENQLQQTENPSNERDEKAYMFSLYGWESLNPAIPGVKCTLCFNKTEFEDNQVFDLIKEHSSYCPWKNVDTANAYVPQGYLKGGNQRINGTEWMIEIIELEYNLLVKRQDLSLSSLEAADQSFYKLKQEMYKSKELLDQWKLAETKTSTSEKDN